MQHLPLVEDFERRTAIKLVPRAEQQLTNKQHLLIELAALCILTAGIVGLAMWLG